MEPSDISKLKNVAACISPRTLMAFLRVSRQQSDDNIQSELSPRSCHKYIPKVFEEWSKRDALLAYCESVARSETISNDSSAEDNSIRSLPRHARDQIEFAHTKTDPRVDSYGARNENRIEPSDLDQVAQWVKKERETESIIRDTTVDVFVRRCGSVTTDPNAFFEQYCRFVAQGPS